MSFDLAKELAKLNEEKVRLQAQLDDIYVDPAKPSMGYKPGVTMEDALAIRGQLRENQASQTATLQKLPEPVTWKSWVAPVALPLGMAVFLIGYRSYMPWRHNIFGKKWPKVKYTRAQIERRMTFFKVVNAPLTGEISVEPRTFNGLSHESFGRFLFLWSWINFCQVAPRWYFWKQHPELLHPEETEGELVRLDAEKKTAIVNINGAMMTVPLAQIRCNQWGDIFAGRTGVKIIIRLK